MFKDALDRDLDITLQEVADTNKQKLEDRLQRDNYTEMAIIDNERYKTNSNNILNSL